MSDGQMQEFRSPVDQTFCQKYCVNAPIFPNDDCRRCWIDVELQKVREGWHQQPLPETMAKFAWCVEDVVQYCFGKAVKRA